MNAAESNIDVVAVGAHPDDIEIACGGTLASLSDQGYRVAIVDLTDGEPTPHCNDPAIRRQEARLAAERLGVSRFIMDLPNRRLFDSFEARVALATLFRKLRPKLVIALSGRTPLASPDHYQAMLITDAAIFYSRLTKWDQHFQGLPTHTITAQVYCHLGYQLPGVSDQGGQLTTDITGQLSRKIESIRCYRTQFPPEKQDTLVRVENLALAAGAAAGFGAGEIFWTTRAVGCRDLVKSVIHE
jgi:LmbE family N-acetylglucosaminyl deacetylase